MKLLSSSALCHRVSRRPMRRYHVIVQSLPVGALQAFLTKPSLTKPPPYPIQLSRPSHRQIVVSYRTRLIFTPIPLNHSLNFQVPPRQHLITVRPSIARTNSLPPTRSNSTPLAINTDVPSLPSTLREKKGATYAINATHKH